jgi:pimeloyl-ACP methyl ester carboxylesterase
MQSLVINGRRIAFQDTGTGPTVILGHCSSASHREWTHLTGAIQDRYRVLNPDLIGYGKSDRWPDGATLTLSDDPGVLLGLAGLVDGPVHLAAHSYGAAVALEAALALGDRVQSLTLIEPVSFHLLKMSQHPEWNRIQSLAARVDEALAAGRKDEAAAVFMTYWIGPEQWRLTPPEARQKIAETIGKVAAEFAMLSGITRTPDEYAAITVPTRLIYGEKTTPAARAVTDILSRTMEHAAVNVVPGAGHMSPFTHAAEVSRLVASHLDAVASPAYRTASAQ